MYDREVDIRLKYKESERLGHYIGSDPVLPENDPRNKIKQLAEWAVKYHAYRWKQGSWEKVPGGIKRVAIGTDGSVWGVNKKNEFHERIGNRWKRRSGTIIAFDLLDRGAMFGISRYNVLHRGVDNKWKKVKSAPSSRIIDVSIGSQGTGRTKKVGGKPASVTEVFGYIINMDGEIWEFSFERYSRLGYMISSTVEKVGEAVTEAVAEETAKKAAEEAAKEAAQ